MFSRLILGNVFKGCQPIKILKYNPNNKPQNGYQTEYV